MLIIKNMTKKANEAVETTPAQSKNLPAVKNDFKAAFDVARTADAVEITSEYKKFEEGESEMLAFLGMTTMGTQDGDQKQAVTLADEDGNKYTNADAVVVSTLSRIPQEQIPCVITITCTGSKKSAKGTYSTFSITKHG